MSMTNKRLLEVIEDFKDRLSRDSHSVFSQNEIYIIYLLSKVSYPSALQFSIFCDEVSLQPSSLEEILQTAKKNALLDLFYVPKRNQIMMDVTESLETFHTAGIVRTTKLIFRARRESFTPYFWNAEQGFASTLSVSQKINLSDLDRDGINLPNGQRIDLSGVSIRSKAMRILKSSVFFQSSIGKKYVRPMFKRLISARNLFFNFNSPLKTNQFVFFFESNIFMNEYANLNVTTFDRLNVLFAHSKNNLFLTIHDELVLRLPHLYEPSKVGEFYQLCAMAKNARKIFVPSIAESRNVARHFDQTKKLIVIPWEGRDLIPKNLHKLTDIDSVDKVFLHFSGSDSRKNTERVIKAFSILRSDYDNLELHIVGRKPADNSTVHQVIASLDIKKKRVFFHSYLSSSELVLLYERTMVLVYCSLAEGYGLPIVEAANYSCVVVGSDFGAVAEVATKYSHHCLVDPYSIHSIANGMENALAGKTALPQDNGLVARGWDAVAEDIFMEILGEPES